MEGTAGGPDRRAVGSQIGGIESDQRRTAPVPCVYRGMWEKEGMKQFSKIALIAIFAAFLCFFGLSGGRALAIGQDRIPGTRAHLANWIAQPVISLDLPRPGSSASRACGKLYAERGGCAYRNPDAGRPDGFRLSGYGNR
jgi:hypothetical protein